MEHPITPPPELVQEWRTQCSYHGNTDAITQSVACMAARWGADQELEACCTWLSNHGWTAADLHAARRPKPLSLVEQALDRCNDYIDPDGIIRAALERLQELEKGNE